MTKDEESWIKKHGKTTGLDDLSIDYKQHSDDSILDYKPSMTHKHMREQDDVTLHTSNHKKLRIINDTESTDPQDDSTRFYPIFLNKEEEEFIPDHSKRSRMPFARHLNAAITLNKMCSVCLNEKAWTKCCPNRSLPKGQECWVCQKCIHPIYNTCIHHSGSTATKAKWTIKNMVRIVLFLCLRKILIHLKFLFH